MTYRLALTLKSGFFSDDCVCYREIRTVEDTLKLQKDIDLLGSWARKWGMRFQPVKCNMMQLTNKLQINKIEAAYILEETVLENVDSIKYLGVTITNDLKWNTHINNICTKANRTLGFLRRNLFSCPPKMLKKQLIKEWCAQSWNMEVLFGIPILNASRRNWRRYRILPLDL